ncbi:DUF6526 family protein [Paenibacillus sp. P26]|nr:DUF6526 family protein [Paenibacillus sp. P26]
MPQLNGRERLVLQEQNYANHRKIDPKYHFILAPLSLIVLIGTVIFVIHSILTGEWVWLSVLNLLIGIVLVLTVVLVRMYPLIAQDRIIRTEQQIRHYILTGKPLDPSLTLKQLAGLRFAGDAEFPELCRRAAKENLSGDQIKRLIKEWKADHDRI